MAMEVPAESIAAFVQNEYAVSQFVRLVLLTKNGPADLRTIVTITTVGYGDQALLLPSDSREGLSELKT